MEQAIEEFKKYTKDYLQYGDMCQLKVNHTFRVMDLCADIAEDLGLCCDDVELARLCGLLHDIARFEQWKNYKTFADAQSIDHGDLGVEILKTNNFIRKFNTDEGLDDFIFKTIKNHNKYMIEDGLSEKEKLFCNIVRDADKIDILYLYTVEEIVLDMGDEDFSDKVYEALINKKCILRSDKKTKADWLAISLGFVFDLNFDSSYKLLKEKDYFNKEIDIYKNKNNNKDFLRKLENIRNVINEYIDGRCSRC